MLKCFLFFISCLLIFTVSSISFAAPFSLTPLTYRQIYLIEVGAIKDVSFTVTNSTSTSLPALSFDVAYNPNSHIDYSNITINPFATTCVAGDPLAPGASCEVSLMVTQDYNYTTQTIAPRVCAFKSKRLCTMPTPSNQVTVTANPNIPSKAYIESDVLDSPYTGSGIITFYLATKTYAQPIQSSNFSINTDWLDFVFSPDGKTGYTPGDVNGTPGIMVFNTTDNKVKRFILIPGLRPYGLSVSPDGKKLYAYDYYNDKINVISTVTDQQLASITIASNPLNMIISPNGKRLYISFQSQNSISVIDTTTNTVIKSLNLPGFAYIDEMAISPDGKTLYVLPPNGSAIAAVDTGTEQINPIPLAASLVDSYEGIVISPDGGRLYVSNFGKSAIYVIDTQSKSQIATVSDAKLSNPEGLALSPDNKQLYITDGTAKTLHVMNTNNNTIVGNYIVPGQFYGLTSRFIN